jgi:hypothetical protein
VSLTLAEIGLSGTVNVRDLWNHQDLPPMNGSITAIVNSHGAVIYRVSPSK